MNRAQGGFTLIELVAIIIVLAILSSVAVPKYLDMATKAKTNAAKATLGNLRATNTMAFAKHRLDEATATGSNAGADQWVTDCNSLKAYLENNATWPDGVSCTGGVVTFQDATTATIGAETATSAATLN